MFSKNNRYFLASQLSFSILIMLFCSKGNFATASCPWYLLSCIAVANRTNKTMIDHYPKNSKTNGCTLKKHSMVMVQWFQNHWKQSKYSGLKKLNFIAYIFFTNFGLYLTKTTNDYLLPKKLKLFSQKSLCLTNEVKLEENKRNLVRECKFSFWSSKINVLK